ncbi:hypothetical protein V1527DRAFT_410315, partial [Lipomyces starkeyi]
DNPVAGVAYIIHVASLFHYNFEEPVTEMEIMQASVNGSILKSAHEFGALVKWVVIKSSFATSLLYPCDLSWVYTYADTNPILESDCFQKSVGHAMTYCAAKTSAEHATRKFMAETTPRFSTVTLCTLLMLGPVVHNV